MGLGGGSNGCYSLINPTTGPLLGNGLNQPATNVPVQVPTLSGIVAIKAGADHSLALKNDGTLWAWGYNYNGQLGNNSTVTPPTPVKVSGLTNVVSFAAGQYSYAAGYNIAEKSDGSVWTWGSNSTGNGTLTPMQVLGVNGNGYLYLIPPTTADLALTITASPQSQLQPNFGIRYSGTVRNLGPGLATNAKVTFSLPAGASLIGTVQGNCSATANTVTCLLGNIWQSNSLNPNTDVAFAFDIGSPVAGSYVVSATVSSDLIDPTPTNNSITTPSTKTSTTFSLELAGDDVPTLPEWGMILLAVLLLASQIRQNRKIGIL